LPLAAAARDDRHRVRPFRGVWADTVERGGGACPGDAPNPRERLRESVIYRRSAAGGRRLRRPPRSPPGPRGPRPERMTVRMANEREIPIKIPESVLPGVYANQMVVRHSREEFILDFITLTPPEGVVTARVIVSPGHLKRMIEALSDNLQRYEKAF